MKKLLVAMCLCFSLMGCGAAVQAVVAALPTIVQFVQDAVMVLDLIDRSIRPVIEQRADEELRNNYDKHMVNARQALVIALRSAEGSEELSKEKVKEAFTSFNAAYVSLKDLLERNNLMSTDRMLMSGTGAEVVEVPEPLAVQYSGG